MTRGQEGDTEEDGGGFTACKEGGREEGREGGV